MFDMIFLSNALLQCYYKSDLYLEARRSNRIAQTLRRRVIVVTQKHAPRIPRTSRSCSAAPSSFMVRTSQVVYIRHLNMTFILHSPRGIFRRGCRRGIKSPPSPRSSLRRARDPRTFFHNGKRKLRFFLSRSRHPRQSGFSIHGRNK